MPLLRPSTRLLLPSSHPLRSSSSIRTFSSSIGRPASNSHEDHFEPPTGWLWGVPPGAKQEKEGWEGIIFWGFCGSTILGIIAYAYKPDTSIQTWALEEARRRLEAEGILEDPDSKK